MKKIFWKLVDRLHCIWIVLTRKEFVMFAYNHINKGVGSKGATAVISDIENKEDEKLFFEVIIEYLKQEFKKDDSTDSLS